MRTRPNPEKVRRILTKKTPFEKVASLSYKQLPPIAREHRRKIMDWSLLYRNMPVEIKDFLQTYLENLDDFEINPVDVDGVYSFHSPSTSIGITYAFEDDGQLLMIWFPGVDDPTIENHCIFLENDEKRKENTFVETEGLLKQPQKATSIA